MKHIAFAILSLLALAAVSARQPAVPGQCGVACCGDTNAVSASLACGGCTNGVFACGGTNGTSAVLAMAVR